jgi:hypothetical protein
MTPVQEEDIHWGDEVSLCDDGNDYEYKYY